MNVGHEDLEHVVGAARRDLQRHDLEPPLFRWIHNYADRRDVVLHKAHLHIAELEGKRWRIDVYRTDADRPFSHFYVDGRAPAPPVLEYRPPAPKPVRPRWRVKPIRKVQAWEPVLRDMRDFDRSILEALMIPAPIANAAAIAPEPSSLRLEHLTAMIAKLPPPDPEDMLMRGFLEPLMRRTMDFIVEDPPAFHRPLSIMNYGLAPIRTVDRIINIGLDPAAPEPMKKPPPAKAKRN